MPLQTSPIVIEGNNVYINTLPQTGIIALTSFADSTNETSDVQFTKTFCYSFDGINFSDWLDLTLQNIVTIPVTEGNILVIQINYQQPYPQSGLTLNSIDIETETINLTNGYYFKNSIFSEFFNSTDVSVLNWVINVLEKLFQPGLLPAYMDRTNDAGSTDDFLNYWRSVCTFFSYYVMYARQYQKFNEVDVLMREYLGERGLIFSPAETIKQLNQLMHTFYYQIAQRGTLNVFHYVY